jgi:acetyl esterase/lipase
MMRFVILFLCLLLRMMSYCQDSSKIDTSYTVASIYLKEKKKFLNLEIAKNSTYKNVFKETNVPYKSIGLRTLYADIYYKKSKQPNPAVILIHGGGWKSGDKSQMESLAIEIASKGYICFAVAYRLSAEAQFPAAVIDIKDVILFVKQHAEQYNIHPFKIALLGCSSGGQLASLVGTTSENESTNVQAIINMDGILSFKHPDAQEGKAASLWLGGDYQSKPIAWEQASPLYHTNKNTPPILFINSGILRFQAGRTAMIAKLNQYKIYNDTKTFVNAPHSFWFFKPWFKKTVQYSVRFLDLVFKDKKHYLKSYKT